MTGLRCPTAEHRPRTEEGAALWRAAQSAGVWVSVGLGQLRLDRAQLLAVAGADLPGYLAHPLCDALEAGALAELNRQAQERARISPRTTQGARP